MNRLLWVTLRPAGFTALATICLIVATPASIDSARWWRSPRVAGALQLTPQQTEALDRIYRRMSAQAVDDARRTATARAHANRLIAEAPQEALDAAAMALADAESAQRRTRTRALYEMFRALSPEQRAKLVRLVPRARRAPTAP